QAEGAGTGLGLPIVYGIVSKHGGAVTLNSRPGRGTRVTIELPTTDEPVVPQTTPGNPGPASRAPGAVVLVVEDSDMVRDLVARTLREEGHTVLTAEDGQRAVEVLEQHPEIQLAILDVVMPKLTGPQVCDIIHARYPRVKVLFTSGYSAETLPPRYLENHGVYLLRKPYPPDQLVATVRRVLDE
ncbi:MAG: response regulator, partial [Planctomycetota bacterium]|nr:response regulator [Planctomycetota bacterium]